LRPVDEHLHLVAGSGIRRATGGDQDVVGLLPVRDHGRFLDEVKAIAIDFDRADAGAEIAADAELRRGRGDEPLPVDERAQVVAEVRRIAGVMHDARDLDLVHREDHRGRSAVLAERLAEFRDLDDVEAEASEVFGDVRAHQTQRA
jgi:hypothetical protein